MSKKLASWKSTNLSLAGRITLCKSVPATIPLSPMQSSILPKPLCYEIEKRCRSSIWERDDDRGKVHLFNWKTLCQPKLEGGLGLRSMHSMNKALL
jgi:hypothetical protein